MQRARLSPGIQVRDRSAQVLARYGFCLDIVRLEGITGSGKVRNGYFVLLTSDHLYWDTPKDMDNNDADFVSHEERVTNGTPAWSASASAGTTKNRKTPIDISGGYRADWREYSDPQERGTLVSGTCW